MNNATTAHAPLRHSESASILAMQLLGLIERDGSSQFRPTEKANRLKAACDKQDAGDPLNDGEQALIAECCGMPN